MVPTRPITPFRRTGLRFLRIGSLWLALLGAGWSLMTGWAASTPRFDLVLRNGRIIDGAGNPARHGDIAIAGGRIAQVGRIPETGVAEIDLQGRIVAPGFIDVHTHAEQIERHPLAENFIRMGVTTIVLGNCGSSAPDLGELFRRLESNPAAINAGSLVGHGTVRAEVMGGSFLRPPTAEEMNRMKQRIARAMEDGALGLSTGLIYLPGVFSTTEELIELARVAAQHNGIYVSHMRDEGSDISAALEELFRIAREARLPAHISHLKLSGRAVWGRAAELLATIDRVRSEGLDITHDLYVYTAASTGISQLVPEEYRRDDAGGLAQALQDPETKSRLIAEMKKKLQRRGEPDYHYVTIAHYAPKPRFDGLSIPDAARVAGGSGDLEGQINLILDICRTGGASAVFHGMSEADLQQFLTHPHTMVASDSGIRVFGEGVPHPRGYGNNARLLARYVRELKLLRLEEAVRRMTFLPARTFQIPERGLIQPGFRADLVVFDPDEIQDRATYNQPHQYPDGIHAVFVNGVPVFQNGAMTGARPGQVVRRDGWKPER